MVLPFVRTVIERDEVDSTSDLAKQLLAEGGVALPLLVRAERQTKGRGRGDHAWWSDSGSLLFTVGLDPAAHGLRPEHEPRLGLAAALAVIEAASGEGEGLGLAIRWPNDIEAGGRKLGGVLPERVETAGGPRLAVGIGVNVACRLEDAPVEIRRMATTLEALRGGPVDGDELLGTTLARFDQIVQELARDDPGLAGRWQRLDALNGSPVRIALGPRVVEGTARGIAADGGLRVESGGRLETIYGGQVLRDDLGA